MFVWQEIPLFFILYYVSELKNIGKQQLSFILWKIQNQLLESIFESILFRIHFEVLTVHIFNIFIDLIFDESKKELVSFVIRFIDE